MMKPGERGTNQILAEFRSVCETRVRTKHHKLEHLSLTNFIILQFFLEKYFDKKTTRFRPIEGFEVLAYPHYDYIVSNIPQFLSDVVVCPATINSDSVYKQIESIHGDKFFKAIIQYDPAELPYIDSISVLMQYVTWEVDIHGIDLRRLENRELTGLTRKFSIASLTNLWRRLTVDECIEYTALLVSKLVAQKMHVSQSLFPIYNNLLSPFTLGQLFKIIYICTSFSLKKVQDQKLSIMLYQHVLVENIKYYSEKILREKKNIEPFSRPRNLPQSVLSKILFHNMLYAEIDPIEQLISEKTMMKIINDYTEPEED